MSSCTCIERYNGGVCCFLQVCRVSRGCVGCQTRPLGAAVAAALLGAFNLFASNSKISDLNQSPNRPPALDAIHKTDAIENWALARRCDARHDTQHASRHQPMRRTSNEGWRVGIASALCPLAPCSLSSAGFHVHCPFTWFLVRNGRNGWLVGWLVVRLVCLLVGFLS